MRMQHTPHTIMDHAVDWNLVFNLALHGSASRLLPQATGNFLAAGAALGNENANDEKSCRICLEEHEEEKNPLITPCKCIGSVRFIHMDCLKEWLDSKK